MKHGYSIGLEGNFPTAGFPLARLKSAVD